MAGGQFLENRMKMAAMARHLCPQEVDLHKNLMARGSQLSSYCHYQLV